MHVLPTAAHLPPSLSFSLTYVCLIPTASASFHVIATPIHFVSFIVHRCMSIISHSSPLLLLRHSSSPCGRGRVFPRSVQFVSLRLWFGSPRASVARSLLAVCEAFAVALARVSVFFFVGDLENCRSLLQLLRHVARVRNRAIGSGRCLSILGFCSLSSLFSIYLISYLVVYCFNFS